MDNKQEKQKDITIIVNARERIWNEKEISYKQVIELAFESYSSDPNVVYSVTYSKGEEPKHEGSLVEGSSIKVKKGMVFNVTQTNKS